MAHAYAGTKVSNLPERPIVKVWTDGSCKDGIGAWAFVMEYNGVQVKLAKAHDACTSSQEMELMAFLQAMKHLKRPCRVELVSDSKYLVKGLTRWMEAWAAHGWRKGRNGGGKMIAHHDVWSELHRLSRYHDVFATWRKGHTPQSPPQNIMCDKMAGEARRKAFKVSVKNV